jgi:outer membrane protein TolC
MSGSRSTWQRLRRRIVGSLVAPGLLAVAAEAHANPQVLPPPPGAPSALVVQPLDLPACRALALEKQPAVVAARASLAAALARHQALENLHLPTFLQRDLPTRRKQSAAGLTAAEAAVLQAEIDTSYAVQFSYVSWLYARTQSALADDVLVQLRRLLEGFAKPEKQGDEDVNKRPRARLEALVLLAEGRRQEATVGGERAQALLREAIGLDGDCPPLLARDLPPVNVEVDRQAVVQMALSRRPEITQATVGTEVTDLEIQAQSSRRCALTLWTFAAGSDIHANPLPIASFSNGYRPGAIGMEMPVTINGKRADRIEQARIYNSRAHSLLEKTQNLIRLETEQAWFRWKEATTKVARFERGLEKARAAYDPTTPPDARRLTDYLDTARLVTDLRFELNRARYELMVALLALERATAGGFCAGLDKAPAVMESPR